MEYPHSSLCSRNVHEGFDLQRFQIPKYSVLSWASFMMISTHVFALDRCWRFGPLGRGTALYLRRGQRTLRWHWVHWHYFFRLAVSIPYITLAFRGSWIVFMTIVPLVAFLTLASRSVRDVAAPCHMTNVYRTYWDIGDSPFWDCFVARRASQQKKLRTLRRP